MADFGTWTLSVGGSPQTLPEPTDFSEDVVRGGGIHLLLGGKAREDKYGTGSRFTLRWAGLTKAESDNLKTWLNSDAALLFTCHLCTNLPVVVGNTEPFVEDKVGFVSTSAVLLETVA